MLAKPVKLLATTEPLPSRSATRWLRASATDASYAGSQLKSPVKRPSTKPIW